MLPPSSSNSEESTQSAKDTEKGKMAQRYNERAKAEKKKIRQYISKFSSNEAKIDCLVEHFGELAKKVAILEDQKIEQEEVISSLRKNLDCVSGENTELQKKCEKLEQTLQICSGTAEEVSKKLSELESTRQLYEEAKQSADEMVNEFSSNDLYKEAVEECKKKEAIIADMEKKQAENADVMKRKFKALEERAEQQLQQSLQVQMETTQMLAKEREIMKKEFSVERFHLMEDALRERAFTIMRLQQENKVLQQSVAQNELMKQSYEDRFNAVYEEAQKTSADVKAKIQRLEMSEKEKVEQMKEMQNQQKQEEIESLQKKVETLESLCRSLQQKRDLSHPPNS